MQKNEVQPPEMEWLDLIWLYEYGLTYKMLICYFYQSDISPDGILYLGDADKLVCTVGTR